MTNAGLSQPLDITWLQARVRALVPDEDDISPSDNLLFFGLDSLSVMSLVAELKQAGITLSARELFDNPTIENWWNLIAAQSEVPTLR